MKEKNMHITPITPTTPHCYGVLWAQHSQCARYQAVDGATGSPHTIGTCNDTGDGERPLFVLGEVAA